MLRLGADEFQALQERIAGAAKQRRAQAAEAGRKTEKPLRRNKYGAQAIEIDGHRFDSKAEGRRYLQLKAMQKAGGIKDLELQVEYLLIPAQKTAGRSERPVKYVADFRYKQGDHVIVEDTKSAPTKTKEYTIKRKLMLWIHGIAIREVLMD
jgi:hypothetical protein